MHFRSKGVGSFSRVLLLRFGDWGLLMELYACLMLVLFVGYGLV